MFNLLQTFFILVYFQKGNNLLPLLLTQKEFYPSLESLRKLCQIMDLNILERGTLNMTSPHYTKSNEQIERTIDTLNKILKWHLNTMMTFNSNVALQQTNKNNLTVNEYKYSYKKQEDLQKNNSH